LKSDRATDCVGFGGQRLILVPNEELIATSTGWDIIKDPAVETELAEPPGAGRPISEVPLAAPRQAPSGRRGVII
jgi:hypothetical protein